MCDGSLDQSGICSPEPCRRILRLRMSPYDLNVTIHVLAAIFWLGGMFFLAAVGAPALRAVQPPEVRTRLFRELGRKARGWGWIAIAILLATGVGNLHFRGGLGATVLGNESFWGAPYGRALAWKLGAVALMLPIQLLHDFWLGPGASRHEPGSPASLAARRRAAWLGRVNAVLALVLVVAAVRLARGG